MIRTWMLVTGFLAVSCSALVAQQGTAGGGEAVGCYSLSVGGWEPRPFAEAHPRLTNFPLLLELRAERAPAARGRTVYRARGHGDGYGLDWKRWWRVIGDSVAVVTSELILQSGARLVLAMTSDGVDGRAQIFLHGPEMPPEPIPIEAQASVSASRVPCPIAGDRF